MSQNGPALRVRTLRDELAFLLDSTVDLPVTAYDRDTLLMRLETAFAVREAAARSERDAAVALAADLEMIRVSVSAERDAAVLERDEAGLVSCPCHPGLRWPNETWGRECPLSKAESQVTALRERLASTLADIENMAGVEVGALHPNDFEAERIRRVLADTEASATTLLERVRREERERCAVICEERAVLNDAVEGAEDEATDPHTGVRATAADHRGMEARYCAGEIRSLSEPSTGKEGT